MNLTTAEKNELAKDPAVRAVLDAFGGKIEDYLMVGQPKLFTPPPAAEADAPAPIARPAPHHHEPDHDEDDDE